MGKKSTKKRMGRPPGGGAGLDVTLHVRMAPPLRDAITRVAQRQVPKQTPSDLVRNAMTVFVGERES